MTNDRGRVKMRISIFMTIALATGLALTTSAMADGQYDQFNDRFRVYLGGFWPEVDSKIGINGDVLPRARPSTSKTYSVSRTARASRVRLLRPGHLSPVYFLVEASRFFGGFGARTRVI